MSARSPISPTLTPGRDGAVDLFRRRHALADGPALGRRASSTPSPGTGPSTDNAEITLEANPTSVEAERFRGYRAAGVNRVSLGVQSLREGPLAELGRRHTVDEAIAAVRLAQSIFPRSSFDLIYARPHQTLDDWEDELTEALWLAPGHLSLYQLTIEMGTRYYDLCRAGKLKMPDEDLSRRFLRADAGTDAEAGPAGLRDLQPRPPRPGKPAQPALLALRRICRRRPGRPWPAADRQPAPRHRHRKAALRLAESASWRAATAWSPTTS